LERFTIELSWKSSKIEGNTYTLLDTEKLIREGVESVTNTKEEAIMILNHKKSLNYILESIKLEKNLESFRELENIHRLLVLDLGINHGLRSRAVGITGTKYLPLDMFSQIENETKRFVETIKKQKNNFSKALISILFISYLQSFEDGNKRTARLYANAMLLSAGLAPLSYRDVDEKKYREAILIFYEQNSVEAFKEIFIEQYIFSCNTYNLG
jgi:Fic family protein